MKKFLITGSGGQLAKELAKALDTQSMEFKAPPEEDLNITDIQRVTSVIEELKPDVILNCAAFNLVDDAEKNPSIANSVNYHAVENIASICKRMNIFLIHYSTDYVFDGKKRDFYREEDKTNPVNEYGRSKLRGEEAIMKNMDDFLILRLSWVFGMGKNNFLYKLSGWAKQNNILKISADEISVPTYTEDIASLTLSALKQGLTGTFHLTNSGYCSRYELAKYFVKKMKMNNVVTPVSMSQFKTTAKRPLFSAMANSRISKELSITIPEWENGVDRFITGFPPSRE